MKHVVIAAMDIDCDDVFCGKCYRAGRVTSRLRDGWVLGEQHRCTLFLRVCIRPRGSDFRRCRACLAAERKAKLAGKR